MKVTVKLLGALGDLADTAEIAPIDFTLPDAATATDLVARLAQRFGGPFGESFDESANTTASQSGCPSRIQLFVNGEFSPKRDRPLAVSGAESATVQVVIMKTITGG
jgi:hypothetical protein